MRRATLIAAAAAATLTVPACGGGGHPATPTPTPTPKAPPHTAAPAATPPPLWASLETRGTHLAAGITEPNANLVSPAGDVPQPFARWRDALAKLHPALYRLIVYWPAVQPAAGRPPDLSAVNGGCLRARTPCAAFAGIRAQLRALAARQREGGWEALVVITGTPAWAAEPPSGCERPGTGPANRMPRRDALAAYVRLVAAVEDAAGEEGARLRYWAPWNEPNHPFSSSPQRARCDAAARSVAARPYLRVAQALRDALRPDERYVIGELAALVTRRPYASTAQELLGAFPRGLTCGAAALTLHAYIGGADILGIADRALRAEGCPSLPIWITETGAGAARTTTARGGGRGGERAGCRALHRQLRAWYADPRVTAAVQYTLREDDLFPTGLVTTDLRRPYPALAEWQQWGQTARPRPEAPPPPRAACPG